MADDPAPRTMLTLISDWLAAGRGDPIPMRRLAAALRAILPVRVHCGGRCNDAEGWVMPRAAEGAGALAVDFTADRAQAVGVPAGEVPAPAFDCPHCLRPWGGAVGGGSGWIEGPPTAEGDYWLAYRGGGDETCTTFGLVDEWGRLHQFGVELPYESGGGASPFTHHMALTRPQPPNGEDNADGR